MDSPLLTTKTQAPPLTPDLVARPRLVDRLNAGLRPDVRLTLVSAPPGFGKTTLVQQWLQTVPRRSAWLSLDAGDNDLVRFANYLAAALRHAGLDVTVPVQVYPGTPYALQPEVLLTGVLNEINAGSEPFVLVLDDYHSIHTPPIHDALAFLIEHQPAHMHLVLTTRTEPPLPLARLRARRQVNELRANDLRFAPQEIAVLLHSLTGLDLSAQDIATIEQQTEGWVATLHLAALSQQEPRDASSLILALQGEDRYVLDYLAEEILHQQPQEVQSFLLQTSVLEQFTPPLCDYLLGEQEEQDQLPPTVQRASDLLQHLERSNLFLVPLDDRRRWYRYHRLFGDFLRKRLGEGMRSLVPTLHRRAAGWYEKNGWVSEAIYHALAGQDYEHAARLICAAWEGLFTRGEVATLDGWVASLPERVLEQYPNLLIIQAWSNLLMLNLDAMLAPLSKAGRVLPSLPPAESQRIAGSVEALRAYLDFFAGDMSAAIALSRQALERLPAGEDLQRGMALFNLANALLQDGQQRASIDVYQEVIPLTQKTGNQLISVWAIHSLSLVMVADGRLGEAEENLRQAVEMVTLPDGRVLPAACLAYAPLSEIETLRLRLNDADYNARQALRLSQMSGIDGLEMEANLAMGNVLLSRGEFVAAAAHIDRAGALADKMEYEESRHLVLRYRSLAALKQGDLRRVEGLLSRLAALPGVSPLEQEARAVLEMDYRLAKAAADPDSEELDAVIAGYEALLERTYAGGQALRRIGLRLSLARAHDLRGRRGEAVKALEAALAEAEPEGLVGLFAGQADLGDLLRHVQERGQNRAFARRVMSELAGEQAPPAQTGGDELPEPLSERELEVLRWMARGLSGPEIAGQLVVAPSTVKTHTKNIFQKLNAHSRYEAVEKARKLGIV